MALSGFTLKSALFVVGYGAYKAASAFGYLNALGVEPVNLGFVSNLPFMMTNCLMEAVTAFAIVALSRSGRMATGRYPFYLAYGLVILSIVAGIVANAVFSSGGVPLAASIVLGVLKGIGGVSVYILWYELLVLKAPRDCASIILGAFALNGVLGIVLSAIPSIIAVQVITLVLLAVSFACVRRLMVMPCEVAVGEFTAVLKPDSDAGRDFLSAFLCLLVCHFVVGIANTAVFESSFASIMSSVDVDVCILAAVCLLAVYRRVMRRMLTPVNAFKFIMPLLLAVFTLSAVGAGMFGIVTGYAMIGCYEAIAFAYSIFFVTFLREGRYRPVLHTGVTTAISSLTLLLGLILGIVLSVVCNYHELPFFTVLAFIAIYPLGIAFMFMLRNRARNEASAARREALSEVSSGAQVDVEPVTRDDVEDYMAARMKVFAARYGLTKREAEVCTHLTRGHTAKSVSEALGISENTAWTHIRNVYSKCGVKTKSEFIDLFERSEGDGPSS